MQRRAPSSKFLIARSDQRSAKPGELGVIHAIVREKRFDRRAVGQLDRVFRLADDFFESAEEKYLHARSLGREAHKRIVTRGRVPGHSLRA